MESIGPSIEVSVPSAVTDTPKKASDLNADADDRSNTLLALGKKPDPKLGQWKLNKNQLKKLGIESSVLNALTKLKGNKKSNGKFFFINKNKIIPTYLFTHFILF